MINHIEYSPEGLPFEAGGKFKDIYPARPEIHLIANLEATQDTIRTDRYFADSAEVVVYEGGLLALVA